MASKVQSVSKQILSVICLIVIQSFLHGSVLAADKPKYTSLVDPLLGISMQFASLPAGQTKLAIEVDEHGRPIESGPTYTADLSAFEIELSEHRICDAYLARRDKKMIELLRDPTRLQRAIAALETYYFPSSTRSLDRTLYYRVGYTRVQAQRYCHWLSMCFNRFIRLPTQAEWEFAAKAGAETRYFWGDDESELPKYGFVLQPAKDSSDPQLSAALQYQLGQYQRQFLPNPSEMFDTVGGMEEHVADGYQTKLPFEPNSIIKNPIVWPGPNHLRVRQSPSHTESVVAVCSLKPDLWSDGGSCTKGGSFSQIRSTSAADYLPSARKEFGRDSDTWHMYSDLEYHEGGHFKWVSFRLVMPSVIPGREEQLAHWGITKPKMRIARLEESKTFEEALEYTFEPTENWETHFE